jgi:hypothetical protein
MLVYDYIPWWGTIRRKSFCLLGTIRVYRKLHIAYSYCLTMLNHVLGWILSKCFRTTVKSNNFVLRKCMLTSTVMYTKVVQYFIDTYSLHSQRSFRTFMTLFKAWMPQFVNGLLRAAGPVTIPCLCVPSEGFVPSFGTAPSFPWACSFVVIPQYLAQNLPVIKFCHSHGECLGYEWRSGIGFCFGLCVWANVALSC